MSEPIPQTDVEARWQARFRAVRISLPLWARDRPDRCLYLSNASGTLELHTWDRATGEHRQATDRPNGTVTGTLDPAGEYVWWFDDTDGDEFGVWRRQPYGSTESEVAIPGLAKAYDAGLAVGRTVVVVGQAIDDGCTVRGCRPGGEPALIYHHKQDAWVSALSEDNTLVAVNHSEDGDSLHPDIRVYRVPPSAGYAATATSDGTAHPGGPVEVVGELTDGPGKGVHAVGFAPVVGDQRLLVSHERHGRPELLVWNLATGTVTELDLPLDGDLSADWYPDASALLVTAERAARSQLHRYDLLTGEVTAVDTPSGMVGAATARPDGTIEYQWSSAAAPVQLRVAGRVEPLLVPPGERPPTSVPVHDAWVDGPGGTTHALLSVPDGASRPYATVFFVHGGPHSLDKDAFDPTRAAWIDAGYAVVQVNYRGSLGYGSSWRDAIEGRPGLTELEDIAAVHEWAVGQGIADPMRCVLAGRSWGGYLTLLGLGTQPDRWAAGVGGVPVADYVAAYEDEMEPLKALDRVLFGGSPSEVPEVWTAGSPMTYVENVTAPVLITAGLNDPRCPIRQIENYLARFRELGKPYEEYRFDAGHGSVVVTERIRMMAAELDFVRRHVPA